SHSAQRHSLPRLPAKRALATQGLDAVPDAADAVADAPAVRLEFLLTGAARADSAAESGELGAASGQAWQQIIQMRKFHLKLAFPAARVSREDVEDQLGTINHPAMRRAFDVALLNRAEVEVKDHERGLAQSCFGFELSELSPPDHCGRIELLAHLEDGGRHFRAGAARQLCELGQRFAFHLTRRERRPARRPFYADADQEHAFAGIGRSSGLHPWEALRKAKEDRSATTSLPGARVRRRGARRSGRPHFIHRGLYALGGLRASRKPLDPLREVPLDVLENCLGRFGLIAEALEPPDNRLLAKPGALPLGVWAPVLLGGVR